MKPVRFVMVGGFLGAGKTTALARLARHYMDRGLRVGLVATVVQPLKALYGGRFHVGPYAVLFKPSHGLRILRNEGAGFSPKAAYIFRKQLEEADAIVVNRADELSPAAVGELKGLLAG